MQTNAAGKGPVGAEPKANKAKGKSWVGAHKGLVIAMVVALLGLYYFVKRNSSTANSSTSTDTTGGANSGFAVPAASLGMGGSAGFVDPNSVSGLMNQMLAGQAGLADSISGLLGAQGTTSAQAAAGSATGTDMGSTAGASILASSPAAQAAPPLVIMPNPSSSPSPSSGTSSGTGAAHKTTPTPKKATAPAAKKPAAKPAAAAHTYTVKRGDSLSSIAKRLGISGGWEKLYGENRKAVGSNPNLIHAGLVLHY